MDEEKPKLDSFIDRLEEKQNYYSEMKKRLLSIIFKKKPSPSHEASS